MADEFDPDAYLSSAAAPEAAAAPAFDPDEYISSFNADEYLKPQAEGMLVTGAREAAHAALPAAAGYAGMGAGASYGAAAGAIGGPAGAIAGGIIGGVIGGVGASMVTNAVQEKGLELAGLDDSAQRAANIEENKWSGFVGGQLPAAAGMSVAAGASKLAPLANEVIQRGAGAVFGGGMEAGQEYLNEGHVDPAKVAAAAAIGAVAPGVNKQGAKLVGAGERAVQRFVPGRPNQPANPAADQAHADVSDTIVEVDAAGSSLAEASPPATGETTGNPQSAPVRSERVYKKGPEATEQARYAEAASDPEAMRQFAFEEGITEAEAREIVKANHVTDSGMTQGQIRPDEAAALEATNPAPAAAPEPRPQPDIAPQEIRPQPVMPEPSVEAGIPQQGEPLAMGANDAAPVPPGTPERAAKAIRRSKLAEKARPLTELPGEGPTGKLADKPMPEFKGETHPTPTTGQAEAGNYKKARTHDFGKPVKMETEAGNARKGVDANGQPWEHASPYDYGYFNKTKGADKDHIDFARPKEGTPEHGDKHFIIDQKNAETGKFDEHKVFTYYADEAAARQHYEAGFGDGKGAQRLGAITEVDRPGLVKFLAKHTSKAANKPFSEAFEGAATPLPGQKVAPKDRAVFKDLIAKKPELAEKLMNAPDEAVAAAIEGKRTRKYGVSTGASAGYPVEGVLSSAGTPITANTPAKAAARSAAHKKVVDWFEGSKPKGDPETETKDALIARLLKGAPNIEGWKPTHKPKEWMLAREAQRVIMKPTEGNIAKFREAERLLRGGDESVENYRGGNRVEADIARSRRTGDEAVQAAENQNVNLGRNDVEDAMIADLDAKRAATAKEGKFDVPHEEAEAMVKPTPVKSKADLKELPKKTIAADDSSLAKIDTGAISKAEMRKAEAARLAGKKTVDAPPAERVIKLKDGTEEKVAAGKEGRSIKIDDPVEIARLKSLMEKVSKRGNRDEPLGGAREVVAKPKGIQDLLGDFVGDERGAVHPDKIVTDLRRWMSGAMKRTDHDSYRAMTLKTPEDKAAQNVSDQLQAVKKRVETLAVENLKRLDAIPKADRTPAIMSEIYHAREADSAHFPLPAGKTGTHLENMSPKATEVYKKHLEPIFDESDAIVEAIRRIAPEKIGPDVGNHISRLTNADLAERNLLKQDDDPTNPGYHSLSVNADQAQARKFYALVGADGRRHVIGLSDTGFTKWDKYKPERIKAPDFEFEDGATFKAGNNDYTMRQATSKEIEANALGVDKKPMKYHDNAAFSAAVANTNLGTMAHNIIDLHNIMQTPEFKKLTTRNEGKAKKLDWVETTFPNMKGLFMSPQLAHVFDDFAGRPMSTLAKMNAFVTKTIFWMPVAHIRNVAEHMIVGRGWDNFNPAAWHRLITDVGPRAIRSVVNQDNYQKRMRDAGAGLIYGSVKTRRMTQQIADRLGLEIEQNPGKWGPIADKVGLTAKQLGRAVYDASSHAMWSTGDMLMTMRVMELEKKGMPLKKAIIEAERDIPNYRVPTQVIGRGSLGREWSKLSQNSALVAFGRYHHGMFNSYANIIKDAVSKNATLGDRMDAVGKLMTMGAIAFLVYPFLDKGVQALTGNKDAHIAPRGPMSVPKHMAAGLKGETDSSQWLRGSVTPAPLVSAALTWINGKDFRGKPILEPGDLREATTRGNPKAAARVVTAGVEHTARNVLSPYGTLANSLQKRAPGDSASGAVAKAVRDATLDIKDPSQKAQKYKAQIDMRTNRDAVSRFKHGGSGPLEGLVGKLGYR